MIYIIWAMLYGLYDMSHVVWIGYSDAVDIFWYTMWVTKIGY